MLERLRIRAARIWIMTSDLLTAVVIISVIGLCIAVAIYMSRKSATDEQIKKEMEIRKLDALSQAKILSSPPLKHRDAVRILKRLREKRDKRRDLLSSAEQRRD